MCKQSRNINRDRKPKRKPEINSSAKKNTITEMKKKITRGRQKWI